MTTASIPSPRPKATNEVGFAIAVAAVLSILFVPIPAALLDLALALSVSLAILILMVSLWIEKPLDFSAFPLVLLVTTMLRLALNVATTRLILSHGHEGTHAAGNMVGGFARLVMGGDFVIGAVVFVILLTVNFIVISKGATRIAEVGARFTLDAIPGKQMAVDADLSSGLIDENEARARRAELEQESAFYGSMDGASKFVRGDAIAGLIITFINSFGGIIIGITRHGLDLATSADTFIKLTVGDGLVTQIPALIISLAAGLLVSPCDDHGGRNVGDFITIAGITVLAICLDRSEFQRRRIFAPANAITGRRCSTSSKTQRRRIARTGNENLGKGTASRA
jgi:flagellar biosynthesis protein FlhA